MKFRYLIVFVLMSIAGSVFAKSEFLDLFMTTYKINDSSVLGQKACLICHQTEDDYTKMTPYGRDLKKGLADAGTDTLNVDILKTVSKLDSNGTGKTNLEKIEAGISPGEPAPAGANNPPTPPAPPKPKSIIPKNGFHPAVVHFPIALFIGGLFLDALGLIRKNRHLLLAGWYNILMATVTSFGGMATGLLAMYVQKVPFRGLILTHLFLAVISVLMMVMMVGLRVDRHEKMHLPTRIAYYILATLCFVLISYAGHLGGAFVYGE
ncbi:MAG: DUF2231 domain-containing protein [Fimbriimonas sp.]|nr:DUF2231 domain-containing protein [Fimbriimonas sp.]